jgi:O-antigen ligase
LSNRKNKRQKREKKNRRQELYLAIPLCLIVAVVPLIVYVRKVVVSDPGNLYWDGRSMRFDLFAYYKMAYLLIFAAAGLVLYLFLRKNNPFERAKYRYYIPLGAYSLLVLLSAVFSEYRQVAFFGFLERFEGAFVLLAYSVVLFLAMNIFCNERTVRILFGCLLASVAVITVIGVFQYFGMDLFRTKFFQNMVIPAALKNEAGEFNLRVGERIIYSTLYNPNYVGSYAAMVMPVILVLLIWTKKLGYKLSLAALLALTAINWIGCDSRAGLFGAALAFLVLLVLYRRKIWQRKWIALAVVVVALGGLTVFNFATGNSVVDRISRMLTMESKGSDDKALADLQKKLAGLADVKMDDEKTEIVTEKGTLTIEVRDSILAVTDENGAEVELDYKDGIVSVMDDRFSNIYLKIKPEEGLILVNYNDYDLLDILLTKDGMRSTANRWMTYRNGRGIESFGFEGMEAFGSNRGYIWSRTLPLLKGTVFIGKGPDTFALYFPQYDFLNKLKLYQTGGIFVDKAHNMYLQTALNTGVLSLVAMLVLFGLYAVSSIKVLWKEDFTEFMPAAGLACFAAFCGYAAAGLFNDSNIAVSPVFWVLFGLGAGINIILIKKRYKITG